MVSTAMLSVIFLLTGCGGGGGSQAHNQHHPHHSHGATLALHPEDNSGVRGTASFKDLSKGVLVKLELRGLPKPETLYLAHIHPGTCAQEEKEGEMHEEHHEHGEEIEYPLSEVKSDSEGHGASTTTVHKTSVGKLFSGKDKHVNVHEAGAGNPPVLSCANLKGAG